MRRWGVILTVCFVALAAAAAPVAWFGWAGAMIGPPQGGTRLDLSWAANGIEARVVRTVVPRIEIEGSAASRGAFGLRAKIVLVEDFVPLLVAATVGTDGIGFVSTLFFGPVRIDGSRIWGDTPVRWATVQLSARPRLSFVLGVDGSSATVEPFVGVRVFPSGHGLWEIGAAVCRSGVRLSVGGLLR